MTDAELYALQRIKARIDGLVDRGAHICREFVFTTEGSPVTCATCGYSAEIHLLRDALALVAAARGGTCWTCKHFNEHDAFSCGQGVSVIYPHKTLSRVSASLAPKRSFGCNLHEPAGSVSREGA